VVLKRIKGALDARIDAITEEQAKQRTSQQTPSRSTSAVRRSSSRNLSPSKRPSRSKDGEKTAASGRGPDPAEFDPEFVIGEDDDQPSRAGTPRPKEKAETAETAESTIDNAKEKSADGKDSPAPILSPEIRTRLRRQEKLEPKYTGMLCVYYPPPRN
jgi:hypothetical protein